MAFRPDVGDTLAIEGVLYSVAEHPAAPGIPYGQEGRAGIVYQLLTGGEKRALKVFKPRYQVPAMTTLAERIEQFAGMSGLRVCRRTVITARRHIEVVRQYPDLAYSVLMPWVEGPTWMEVLLGEYRFSPEQSLLLGRAMLEILAGMEERGLAHCDLSGPNILIPILAGKYGWGSPHPIELVDVEQMYAPGLDQPEYLPLGSSGYGHRTAPSGIWNARADRFAGALLVTEMLAWCDERVRSASWGESYFDPAEIQQDTERYGVISAAISQQWGNGVAGLLDQAWRSDLLAECPTFARWLAALPDPASVQQAPPAQPLYPQVGAQPPAVPAPVAVPPAAPQVSPAEVADSGRQAPLQAASLAGGEPGQVAVPAVPAPAQARSKPIGAQSRKWLWVIPLVLVVGLLALGGLVAYQAQQTAQATATQTAQAEASATQQVVDEATAQVAAAETAQSDEATGTVEAQVTATEVALVAASTEQAQAGIDRQLSEAATAEAQSRGTALSIQADLTASPRPAAFSVDNRDRVAPLRRLRGQVGEVTGVAFSADGQMVATTSQDKKIRLWKVADGTLARTIEGQEDVIYDMAFSPGGHLLASSSYDGVRLWEVETGLQVSNLRDHEQRVNSVAFSPDGTLLASGSDDGTARIWRVVDGTPLYVLKGHKEEVTGVAFSPDGKKLATSSMDSTVRVWNVADGTLIRELAGPKGDLLQEGTPTSGNSADNVKVEGGVVSVAFSPDGKRVAAGAIEPEGQGQDSKVNSVWIWTVDDGVPERVIKAADAPVGSLAFSPDGQVLAGNGSYQGEVGLLRVQDGALLRVLDGHTSVVNRLAFSPDGQLLVSGSADNTAILWGIPEANQGPAPTPAPVQAGIGGTGVLDGLKITLNSVRHTQEGVTKQDGTPAEPGDSNEFLFVNVTLENTTDKPKSLYVPGEFKVSNTWRSISVPVDSTGEARIAGGLNEGAGNELAPHAKVTGEMAFSIGQSDKDLTLEYWPMLSPGEVVFKLDR